MDLHVPASHQIQVLPEEDLLPYAQEDREAVLSRPAGNGEAASSPTHYRSEVAWRDRQRRAEVLVRLGERRVHEDRRGIVLIHPVADER
jgi:hypothetical protein